MHHENYFNLKKTYSSTILELLELVFKITFFSEFLCGKRNSYLVYLDNITILVYNIKII